MTEQNDTKYTPPTEGQLAPDFSLPDQNGEVHSLNDFRGKKVLLYFYPKDMTPGCTLEAQVLEQHADDLRQRGVVVIGVSRDSVARHKRFAEKENLSFLLLSDEAGEVCKRYGVLVEKSMFGKKYLGINRESFLIDEDGRIIKHFKTVKPAVHAREVLEVLNEPEKDV